MKKVIGYIAVATITSMFTGTAAFAAGAYVQAQKGTSVIQLNGQTISTSPKLVYNNSTYVQLYSIQNGLQQVFGTRPTWDGTNFNIIAPVSQTSTGDNGTSDGGTSAVKAVARSQLPYTYKSANGCRSLLTA